MEYTRALRTGTDARPLLPTKRLLIGLERALKSGAASPSKDSSLCIARPVKDKHMFVTDEDRGWIVQSQEGGQGTLEALIREHRRMTDSLRYRKSGSLKGTEGAAALAERLAIELTD